MDRFIGELKDVGDNAEDYLKSSMDRFIATTVYILIKFM